MLFSPAALRAHSLRLCGVAEKDPVAQAKFCHLQMGDVLVIITLTGLVHVSSLGSALLLRCSLLRCVIHRSMMSKAPSLCTSTSWPRAQVSLRVVLSLARAPCPPTMSVSAAGKDTQLRGLAHDSNQYVIAGACARACVASRPVRLPRLSGCRPCC